MGDRTVALIVAAGTGSRAGAGLPKQYRRVGGAALVAHAARRFAPHPRIDAVRIVIGAGQEALFGEALPGAPFGPPITGGAERQDSVRAGLEALAADAPDAVLIHDAARPFVPQSVIDRLLQALEDAPGAVPALPVVDTLARGDGALGETVERAGLVRVQTPQAFRFAEILEAHRAFTGTATDDAQVARAHGLAVRTVEGDAMLEKLTFEEDFARAEARLAAATTSRVGLGFDVHALADGEELWLGGLLIPHSRGLKGHSDSDVALHALTDALLGAIGAGDIGTHFPPSDPQWRGAPSARFLEHARDLVAAAGGRIDHVDLTLICEAPKIGPHRDAMRARIAALLRVPTGRVSIKATTTERLGFAGRGEGIAAQAVATVSVAEDPTP